jgi:FtsZ-binding cell division protein ZapB
MSTSELQKQLAQALKQLSTQHEAQLQDVHDTIKALHLRINELENPGSRSNQEQTIGGQRSGYKTLPDELQIPFLEVEELAKKGRAITKSVYVCDLCKHCWTRQPSAKAPTLSTCLIGEAEQNERFFDCNQFEYFKI